MHHPVRLFLPARLPAVCAALLPRREARHPSAVRAPRYTKDQRMATLHHRARGVHQRYAAPCPPASFTPFLPSRARAHFRIAVQPDQRSLGKQGRARPPALGGMHRARYAPKNSPPFSLLRASWHEGSARMAIFHHRAGLSTNGMQRRALLRPLSPLISFYTDLRVYGKN